MKSVFVSILKINLKDVRCVKAQLYTRSCYSPLFRKALDELNSIVRVVVIAEISLVGDEVLLVAQRHNKNFLEKNPHFSI
jgi:hypothetical protein